MGPCHLWQASDHLRVGSYRTELMQLVFAQREMLLDPQVMTSRDRPRPPATARDLLTSPVTSRALFCRLARSAPSRTTRTATRTPSTGCRARPTCRWPTCPAAAPSSSRGVSPLRLEPRSFRQRLTRVHVPAATGTMHFGNATPTQQARCWEELQRLGFRQQRSSVKMPPPSSGLAGDPMPVACRLSCSGLPSGLWRGPRRLAANCSSAEPPMRRFQRPPATTASFDLAGSAC